jgi:predicted dehydrogenase
MQTLKLGIVGGGVNSAVGKVHIIASQLDNRWEVVGGAFSKDPKVNEKTRDQWGFKNGYQNLEEICENPSDFDAVALLTPTPHHFEQAVKLLESGINVVCEKALAMNSREIQELSNVSKITGKKLFTTYNYSGYPMVREIKRQIQSGCLGKLLHIRIEMPQEGFIKTLPDGELPTVQEWRKVDLELPTVSLDLGVHTQNLSYFVTEKRIKSLVSHSGQKGWNTKVVDFVETLADFDDGLTGSFLFGKAFLGSRNGLRISVFGSESSLQWAQIYPDELIKSHKNGQLELVDYASPILLEASKDRYQRFKPGHPNGFIEAFANLYMDIAEALIFPELEYGEFLMSPDQAMRDLIELEGMKESNDLRSWVKV